MPGYKDPEVAVQMAGEKPPSAGSTTGATSPEIVYAIETPTAQVKIRRRINISTSVKGIKTFDCTCEGENITLEALLKESDKLVKALDLRYPAPVEEEKKKSEKEK